MRKLVIGRLRSPASRWTRILAPTIWRLFARLLIASWPRRGLRLARTLNEALKSREEPRAPAHRFVTGET